MKRRIGLVITALIVTLVGCERAEKETFKNEEAPVHDSITKNGLLYRNHTNKTTYKMGELIEVNAVIKNAKSTPYKFSGTPCDGNLTISINNSNSTYRLKGEGDVTPDVCIESFVEHELKPQEKIKASATFNTNKVINVGAGNEEELKPGKYTVILSYNHYQVSVGTIEINSKQ